MKKAAASTQEGFILPASIVTKLDLAKLVGEIETIDTAYTAVATRKKVGVRRDEKIVLSDALDEFLQLNDLKLDGSQRQRGTLLTQLRQFKDKAPVLHMTFAVSADRETLIELVAWVRDNLHPQAVLAVGLQPALVAGVYLRTPNHVYDFSMREALKGSREVLVKELGAARG